MAVAFRTRNQILTAKAETASGSEESPTVGSNAIKVRVAPAWSGDMAALNTDYLQSSLSQSAPIIGGGGVALRASCYMKGSGTGGTAPEYGPLLRACGMSETTLGTAASGTAQAGAAGSITLASGASSTTDAYKGMVIRTTGGTGSGQTNIVTAYNGSTKVATVGVTWGVTPDNTTTYSIDANNTYRPISTALETITAHLYQRHSDGSSSARKRRMVGGAGTFQLALRVLEMMSIDFSFMGLLPATPSDVSDPGAPTYQSQDPEPFINALAYLGGTAIQFSDFAFDLGAQVQRFPNPAATYGYDYAQIIGRAPTGRITPSLVAVSARDAFSDWIASTSRELWLRWGSAAGKWVSVWMPAIRYTGAEPTDLSGYAGESLPFRAVQSDAEIYVSIA